MAEIGRVIRTQKEYVVVEMVRHSACGSCHACSLSDEGQQLQLEARNLCQAETQDYVEIEVKREKFLSAVAIVYGLPLAGLLVGLIIGAVIGWAYQLPQAELIATGGGLLMLAITYLLIRLNEHRFQTEGYRPVAIRRLADDQLPRGVIKG